MYLIFIVILRDEVRDEEMKLEYVSYYVEVIY